MSTSCGWEGKGRYGSFRLQMNVWVYIRAIPGRFCGGDSLRRGAISSVCTFAFFSRFTADTHTHHRRLPRLDVGGDAAGGSACDTAFMNGALTDYQHITHTHTHTHQIRSDQIEGRLRTTKDAWPHSDLQRGKTNTQQRRRHSLNGRYSLNNTKIELKNTTGDKCV